MVMVLLIFLLAAAFYVGVYQPLQSQYAEAQQNYQQADEDYRWLRTQIETIAKLRDTARGADLMTGGIGKLRTALDQSLKKYKLSAAVEIIDEEEGRRLIEIKVDNANGRTVLRWLEESIKSGHLLHAFELDHKGGGSVSALAYFEIKQPSA